MAFGIFNMQRVLTSMLMCIALYCFVLGKAQTGIAGTGNGYLPQPGSGAGDRYGNGVGSGFEGIDGEVVAKALLCLSDKIYSECEESYRLTGSGDLHIPPDYADQYCSGPCLKETNLVLNCINDVFSNFVFYNSATVLIVKDTIKDGCSYGPRRGDFNVAEHIQAHESNSYKFSYPILYWFLPLISICTLLF